MLWPLQRVGEVVEWARTRLWKFFLPAVSRKRLASTVFQPSAKRARTASGARSISPSRTNKIASHKLQPAQRDKLMPNLPSAGTPVLLQQQQQQQHTPQHQSPPSKLEMHPQNAQATEGAAASDLFDNDDGWQQQRRRRPRQHNRPQAVDDDAGHHQQQGGGYQSIYGNGSGYTPRRGNHSAQAGSIQKYGHGDKLGNHRTPSQQQQQHQWQRRAGQGSMRPAKQTEQPSKPHGWQTRKLEQAARAAPHDTGVLREALEQAKGQDYFAPPISLQNHMAHLPARRAPIDTGVSREVEQAKGREYVATPISLRNHMAYPPARPDHLAERFARVQNVLEQRRDSELGRKALATTTSVLSRTLMADSFSQQSRGPCGSLPSYFAEVGQALASPQPTARCQEPESESTASSAPSAASRAAVQGLNAGFQKVKVICSTVSLGPLELKIQATIQDLEALQLSRLQLRDQEAVRAELRVEPEEQDLALVPLSEEDQAFVHSILYHKGPQGEVLTSHRGSGYEITREKMACLRPLEWLNDEVINLYLHLLQERQARPQQNGRSPYPRCHFFNTFFYNKLFADSRQYNYVPVRRWTMKKKLGYSLKDCDKVLVPIHQRVHWCLAIVNLRDRKLEYYDSMGGQDRACLDNLARYITDEVAHKDEAKLDTSDWPRVFPKDIPQQQNSSDCGVFMVKYADYQSRDAPFTFSQDNMEYFRQRMVKELMKLRAE